MAVVVVAAVSAAAGWVVGVMVRWRPGRRSPWKVLLSFRPCGVGRDGFLTADLSMESYVDGSVYRSLRSDRRLRDGSRALM